MSSAPDLTFTASHCVTLINDFAEFCRTMNDENAHDFTPQFHQRLADIDGSALPDQLNSLRQLCIEVTSAELDQSLIHRQGRHKPFGYAGDYQIIDWTYQSFSSSPTARGRFWDRFYHTQVAPLAVCDRKERFGRKLVEILNGAPTFPIRVLNVGSGPCREIVDGAKIAGLGPSELDILCVDADAAAVTYAKKVLGPHWERSVKFHLGNVIRFRPHNLFDFVWSAGLFDYLEDRIAISLLRRLWSCVDQNGIMEIGNFAKTHSTRPWIEWCGNWMLLHRDELDLRKMANASGIPEASVSVEFDRWNAIGFLQCRK